MARVAHRGLVLGHGAQFAVLVNREPLWGLTSGQPAGHRGRGGLLGTQQGQRQAVERVAQLLEHVLGLALAARIDHQPAIDRVDPRKHAPAAGEGARQQLLRDLLAQLLHLLAAELVALLLGQLLGALVGLLLDHGGGQQAVLEAEADQELAAHGMHQHLVTERRQPAAALHVLAAAGVEGLLRKLFLEALGAHVPGGGKAIDLQILEPHVGGVSCW